MKILTSYLLLLLPILGCTQSKNSGTDMSRWAKQAEQVNIIRDQWGIPHVYGKTDADAVFGLLYAQCEDDFPRVEANYIEKLGRQAEVQGAGKVYEDLLHRLILEPDAAKKDFEKAPGWLKKLCVAFADGINYYLATHPEVKPALLTRFEPWWPLLWTDGSIGAISTGGATQRELQSFYSGQTVAAVPPKLDDDPQNGSNGFAFSPQLTASGKAILYINPHVTYYFRPEVHIVSEEGLNAYGAVTWGQFFIYQGFNENCGWMHTSSQADVADLYQEKIKAAGDKYVYQYDGKERPVSEQTVEIRITENGKPSQKKFRTYSTHHGPVVAERNNTWLTLKHHNRDIKGLEQSWMRTKVKSFSDYKQVMYLKENTSNNTVYADKEGNIAYWHGNFMPRRNPSLDWSEPVDGSTSATEWDGLYMVDQMVTVYNPATGWIQNCNSSAATVAGKSSLPLGNFPAYMAPDDENFRGINAVRQCEAVVPGSMTIDKTIALGYTRLLPAMEQVVPALIRGIINGLAANPDWQPLLDTLSRWNYETNATSTATAFAIEAGEKMLSSIQKTRSTLQQDAGFVGKLITYCMTAPDTEMTGVVKATVADLTKRFGSWKVSWGEINRYQRLTGNLKEVYDDNQPSIAGGFAAATWGALPSFVSRKMAGTEKRYGYSGNSFICAVEFGDKVKAKSLLAGGNSNDPNNKAFYNQAAMYTNGVFKEVSYYKEDVLKNAVKKYAPGK